ncbi:MAG: exodeoxyribonuclease III [Alphaproteobacteria bacterium]|nr:exodeoxyribonuclease III [Alphaproteobacteria bacterium]
MKIVSWNINSIKARLEHVKKFLSESKPDILMVQELKGLDFPENEFKELGYETKAITQKAYNGVAVFSKTHIEVIHTKLPGDKNDNQARYIEFEAQNIRFINIYLPNGNPVDTEKFSYKLAWMERLYKRLKTLRKENIAFVIGGDFNIIPENKDCYDPKTWQGDALFHPKTHKAFLKLLHLGLTDAFRMQDTSEDNYTFWDYQRGAWQNGNGIRIDHFLLSPEITDRMENCFIDPTPRGWEKPSDHTPIILEIST